MPSLSQLHAWIEKHRQEIRDDYFSFLRFPSISADPAHQSDLIACAKWVKGYIDRHLKMKSELIETKGAPLVFAEDLTEGSSTLLIYGHYDVQPVDPIELWESAPFTPTERDGFIYARGALDDKGQIYYALVAIRAWKELQGRLPLNLKFCIEGEEESSSLGLLSALPKLREKLKADHLLIPDFDRYDEKTFAMALGCRGLVALEVKLIGSKSDLHSGLYGGIAYNPNRALAELIASLWDERGKVAVPGFYDGVLGKDPREHYDFRGTKESYMKEAEIGAFGGERGCTLEEANWFRPTLEINGLVGGYGGAGTKTVIPKEAIAKISCRLVPNQDPTHVAQAIAAHLRKKAPSGMKVEIETYPGSRPFRGSPTSPLAQAFAKAAEEISPTPCKKVLSGASIPVVRELCEVTGASPVGIGLGLPSDNIHAPNERFDLPRLEQGICLVARTLAHL